MIEPTLRYTKVITNMRRLSEADILRAHREACRLAQPIYARIYRQNYEAGVNAAKSRQAS